MLAGIGQPDIGSNYQCLKWHIYRSDVKKKKKKNKELTRVSDRETLINDSLGQIDLLMPSMVCLHWLALVVVLNLRFFLCLKFSCRESKPIGKFTVLQLKEKKGSDKEIKVAHLSRLNIDCP